MANPAALTVAPFPPMPAKAAGPRPTAKRSAGSTGRSRRGTARQHLLFLPGRGDAYEKYLETLEHWRGQGWRVTALDWRGQAGSGRLGADAVTGHVDDFAQWIGDLAAFWRDWAAGAHGTARARRPFDGRAPGACAPSPRACSCGPTRWCCRRRCSASCPSGCRRRCSAPGPALMCRARRPAPARRGSGARSRAKSADRVRAADARRRALCRRAVVARARPELAMGPGSWGWVGRGARIDGRARPAGHARSGRACRCCCSPPRDRSPGQRAARSAAPRRGCRTRARRLRPGGAPRDAARDDPVRDKALAAIDRFLDRAARAMSEIYDIAVIGAGMAGASLAAELAPHASVVSPRPRSGRATTPPDARRRSGRNATAAPTWSR